MEEQSDTPRTDAAADRGSSLGLAITAWSGIWSLARDLERELAAATRERDAAVIERDENEGVFKVWRRRCEEHYAETVDLKRQRDEARALNVEWAKKAETWLATPEAAQRLQSYRDLGQQVAEAQNERDEARAEIEKLRSALHRLACLGNGDRYGNSIGNDIAREALAATEAKP